MLGLGQGLFDRERSVIFLSIFSDSGGHRVEILRRQYVEYEDLADVTEHIAQAELEASKRQM